MLKTSDDTGMSQPISNMVASTTPLIQVSRLMGNRLLKPYKKTHLPFIVSTLRFSVVTQTRMVMVIRISFDTAHTTEFLSFMVAPFYNT